MKPKIVGSAAFHITQIASIALAAIWFGWKGFIVIFLTNWAINTAKHVE